MKHLKYYTYRLLQRTKKTIFLLVFVVIIIILIISFHSLFFIKIKPYNFLVINLDSTISSNEIDIDSLIREIKDPKYFGIIFKISSSGGDLEVIRIINALKETNKTKICYIDGLATSAAYWICSLSDYIIARPDSIVGNIGAYATFFDISEFLKKIGINITIIKSTPYKDIGSSYRKISEFEQKYIENVLKNITNIFIEDVKSKRGELESITISGLWFLAEDAKRYNLIDEINEFNRVLDYISERFNISVDLISITEKSFKKKRYSLPFLFSKLINDLLSNFVAEQIFI